MLQIKLAFSPGHNILQLGQPATALTHHLATVYCSWDSQPQHSPHHLATVYCSWDSQPQHSPHHLATVYCSWDSQPQHSPHHLATVYCSWTQPASALTPSPGHSILQLDTASLSTHPITWPQYTAAGTASLSTHLITWPQYTAAGHSQPQHSPHHLATVYCSWTQPASALTPSPGHSILQLDTASLSTHPITWPQYTAAGTASLSTHLITWPQYTAAGHSQPQHSPHHLATVYCSWTQPASALTPSPGHSILQLDTASLSTHPITWPQYTAAGTASLSTHPSPGHSILQLDTASLSTHPITWPQYTAAGTASLSTHPITLGARKGSHLNVLFTVIDMNTSNQPERQIWGFRTQGGRLRHWTPKGNQRFLYQPPVLQMQHAGLHMNIFSTCNSSPQQPSSIHNKPASRCKNRYMKHNSFCLEPKDWSWILFKEPWCLSPLALLLVLMGSWKSCRLVYSSRKLETHVQIWCEEPRHKWEGCAKSVCTWLITSTFKNNYRQPIWCQRDRQTDRETETKTERKRR